MKLNGIEYGQAPLELVRLFAQARKAKTWLRICYGGYEEKGYVNNSCGPLKVPILLPRLSSPGGQPITTSGIVEVYGKGKKLLYKEGAV